MNNELMKDDVTKEKPVSREIQDKVAEAEKEHLRKITNADVYLNCRGHASMALEKLHGALDTSTVIKQLTLSIERIIDGKTTEIEAMLITQAKVLEYVCYDALSKLPSAKMQHAEIFANIALRAQNQSRKTLLALAELKNPRRTMFIKQQNNAINQQVNNTNNPKLNDFKNPKKVANELLREVDHEALDFRGTPATIRADKEMEAMANGRG